jgi:integrase
MPPAGLREAISRRSGVPRQDGQQPQSPRSFTIRWARAAARLGQPSLTWHALRHAHASMLIAAGVPITTIAARLGHADPAITLRIYAHQFDRDDSAAADAIDRALGQRTVT